MAAPTTTLTQLLRDIAERLGDAMGIPATGTTTALGSMSTLVDGVRLAYAGADADALGNPLVRIDETVGGGPAAGEYATVSDGGLTPASGAVAFSPNLSNPVQAGTDYSLWRLVHPDDARRALNRVLRLHDREVLVPVSLCPDGDMEDAGTGEYTAFNATLAKQVPTSGEGRTRVRHGLQYMVITPTADLGGAQAPQNLTVKVTPGDQFIASVCMSVVDDAHEAVFRVANANVVGTLAEGRHRSRQMNELFLQAVTIPAGYEIIRIHMLGSLNGGVVNADDAVLWPVNLARFILPTWVDDPADVIEVGYWPLGRELAGTNAYMVDETPWTPWPFTLKPYFADEGGANAYMLELATPVIRPLFVRVRRKYSELATEAQTTTMDRKLLVDCTLREIYQGLELDAVRNKDQGQALLWARLRQQLETLAGVRAFLGRSKEMSLKVQTPRRRVWRGPA